MDNQFVTEFRSLGHVLSHCLRDDGDIQREICYMYVRTDLVNALKMFNCSGHLFVHLSYCTVESLGDFSF